MNKIRACIGDITKIEVDAIVNAANSRLLGGGGVDGCIHRAAGFELREECRTLGGCRVGEAKLTSAYNIDSTKYIIHTVGPAIEEDVTEEDKEKLRNCYWNSLELAKAFPCISTGVYSYPNDEACDVAVDTVKEWLSKNPGEMKEVVFCCFLEFDGDLYKEKLAELSGEEELKKKQLAELSGEEELKEKQLAELSGEEELKEKQPEEEPKEKSE